MFEMSSKQLDFEKKNLIIKKNIQLDSDLTCNILLSSDDQNFADLIINNILDATIDKISIDNTYHDFGIALETINAFLKTWQQEEQELNINIIISIVHKNEFTFSNIGNSSAYLINRDNEVIELTSKKENKSEFSFISSGKIKNDEIIICSTQRLLNILSKSDILDSLNKTKDIDFLNKNIHSILLGEIVDENIALNTLKFNFENSLPINEQKILHTILGKLKKVELPTFVNKYWHIIQKKIDFSSKKTNNILFIIGIVLAIFFLNSILSSVVSVTTENKTKDIAKENIIKAQNYIKLASENFANQDNFNLHISQAEDVLTLIKKEKLFLNDIEKVQDDINILKKRFNKIELFDSNSNNMIYEGDYSDAIKIVKNNLKPYIISKNSITVLLANSKPQIYTFNDLEKDEYFVDALFIDSNMYLLTNHSKVVEFSKTNNFRYVDVSGQKTWETAKSFSSYGKNIYLLGTQNNQIFKHSLSLGKFTQGQAYLKEADLNQIGEILSIAIDGGFYILKKDLSIVKFFSSPSYRLESLIINKLPQNYNREENDSHNTPIMLKARKDISYLYLLMNNKIWIFKPNTTDYKNTQSLTYLGQIEGSKEAIKDFYVNDDGEVLVLNKNGVYKLRFEVSDDRVIIR